MADLFRLLTLDGQAVGAGMLVALVWLVVTVKGLDAKVVALEKRVESRFGGLETQVATLAAEVATLGADVAYLRGRQEERDRGSSQ